MTPIILALVPVVVTFLVSAFKRIPVVSNVDNQGSRNLILRTVAAILSLLGIVGTFMLTGQAPDPSQVQDVVTTLALTFMAFVGSVGGHELAKAK